MTGVGFLFENGEAISFDQITRIQWLLDEQQIRVFTKSTEVFTYPDSEVSFRQFERWYSLYKRAINEVPVVERGYVGNLYPEVVGSSDDIDGAISLSEAIEKIKAGEAKEAKKPEPKSRASLLLSLPKIPKGGEAEEPEKLKHRVKIVLYQGIMEGKIENDCASLEKASAFVYGAFKVAHGLGVGLHSTITCMEGINAGKDVQSQNHPDVEGRVCALEQRSRF